ncbi:MAG: hypothetical protein IKD16_02710 [Bacteroidales bacterium]|nr:hypothetical protein [Bacteroidales bacterium]
MAILSDVWGLMKKPDGQILANLAPRKIRGIESKGMILMAKDENGRMRFVTPADVVDNGACIG